MLVIRTLNNMSPENPTMSIELKNVFTKFYDVYFNFNYRNNNKVVNLNLLQLDCYTFYTNVINLNHDT